jgi:glycosyltransferase involved in cell wall biosynthesis
MKICFLAGANSLHSYRWIRFFADKGHDVHWVSLYRLSLDEYGLNLSSVRNLSYYEMIPPLTTPLTPFLVPRLTNIFRIFSAVKWLRGLLRDINPDLLHVHSVGIYGLAAAMSGFHPIIATAWGSDVLVGGRSRIKRSLVKYILNRADMITCDADHMIDAMERLGIERGKIRLIYFGIDTDRFRPERRNENIRERLGIFNSQAVISLRGLFSPIYDIESVIKAVPYVLKEVTTAKFVIVGTGPLDASLKSLAESLGVSGNINFIGKIPDSDLPEILASMDVYISTSLSDAGIASSTAEAMACGLPVVITDFGDNSKWVKDGEGGFIVPLKNPMTLAEKIIYLLKEKAKRKTFGAVNRATIMDKNDYFKEMTRMERIYEEITKI